jgi:hypothetical protein
MKIVEANDAQTFFDQTLAEETAEEAGASRDERCLRPRSLCSWLAVNRTL